MKNDNEKTLKYINETLAKAEEAIQSIDSFIPKEKLINKYKDAFRLFRIAYYTSDNNVEILNRALKYGIELSKLVGCYFDFKENNYWINCPIMTASFSPISIAASMSGHCSICGEELIDCNHITGEVYDNIVCKTIDGKCNVCILEECEHSVGETYNGVTAYHIITSIDSIDHISLVNNPKDSEVGIESIALNRTTMMRRGKFEIENYHWGDLIECLYCKSCEETGQYRKIQYLR